MKDFPYVQPPYQNERMFYIKYFAYCFVSPFSHYKVLVIYLV